MMNAFATAISIGLQYGVPLETFVRKFSYMRFDPEGMTTNPEIPFAKSLPDYIMRWLASRFLDADVQEELGILTDEVRARKTAEESARPTAATATRATAELAATATASRHGEASARAQAAERCPHRHPAGRPGEDRRARPRPRLLPVRRHDAAHGQLLHLLELRQQHGLRLAG